VKVRFPSAHAITQTHRMQHRVTRPRLVTVPLKIISRDALCAPHRYARVYGEA